MPDIGGWEWVILAVVAMVLFGGTKLATFGKNAGRAIREFKEETAGPGSTSEPAAAAAPAAPVADAPTGVAPAAAPVATVPDASTTQN